MLYQLLAPRLVKPEFQLKPEVESCPCRVCRSDMAYIVPCESPVEIVPVYVIDAPETKQEAPKTAQKTRKSNQGRKI
jgi:hypothetical protein